MDCGAAASDWTADRPNKADDDYSQSKGKTEMTSINPGPKPKREDGKDDRRHHVNPPTKPKHPTLPIHDPKKK